MVLAEALDQGALANPRFAGNQQELAGVAGDDPGKRLLEHRERCIALE
jgi:hypothetical protein